MRVLLVVLDSVGIGALPDAHKYGDEGSNTLSHVALAVGGLALPVMERLGLANIVEVSGLSPLEKPKGCYGRMAEAAEGKDTITGHWEMAGVIVSEPFRTYPRGFPAELIAEFSRRIGRGVLGNYAASGTEIIADLGEEHMKTGNPIVYTSADSVFQIAAHEEVIPLEEQYRICTIARELLHGEYKVARVIARPFIGQPGAFTRTANRRDYALEPETRTVLEGYWRWQN
jgi:phosphopentomutase